MGDILLELAVARQNRLRRPHAPRPHQPTQAGGSGGGGGGGAGNLVVGKIIEVNYEKQEAQLAPIHNGVDKSDETEWADNTNFDVANPICCWTQGYSIVQVGNPGVAVIASNDSQAWLVFAPNFIGSQSDYDKFCEPTGPFSAPASPSCDPPKHPGICSTLYACCKTDGTCADMTALACAAAGGVYHYDASTDEGCKCDPADPDGLEYTCDDPADNGSCTTLYGCCCLGTCPWGGFGTCDDLSPSDCAAGGGISMENFGGCNCDETDCVIVQCV